MPRSTSGKVSLPPIWVINLKRSIERREYITRHLSELELQFDLIEAVDGKQLTPDELAAIYDREQAIEHTGRELTPSEIGCSLSHIKLYQKMVEEDLEEVIILEDDVVIQSDFLQILEHMHLFPAAWELVLLYHGGAQISCWKKQAIYKQYQMVKFATIAYGTLGYMLKKDAARKLLAYAYPIRVPADHLTGGEVLNGIQLHGIYPRCMQQLAEGPAALTTMPDAHQSRKKPPTKAESGILVYTLYCIKTRVLNLYHSLNPRSII